MLDGKSQKRQRRSKHDFAFSRLINCGHCGCSLVGELKKGKYVYYHCTGYKGKCPEPYVREEVLEEKFTQVLKNDGQVVDRRARRGVLRPIRQLVEFERPFEQRPGPLEVTQRPEHDRQIVQALRDERMTGWQQRLAFGAISFNASRSP